MTDEITLELGPVETETTEDHLRFLISFWQNRQGTYTETSEGIRGDSFTEINERHASSKTSYYRGLLEWVESGKPLKAETREKIRRDYKRKLKEQEQI